MARTLCFCAVAAAAWAQALWQGTGGNATRESQLPIPLLAKPAFGLSFASMGKAHGSPVVNAEDDVFWLAWNTTGPFLYAWRAGSSDLEAAALPSDGADIMSDSFDPLVLSEDGRLLFATVSSYGSGSGTPVTLALFDTTKPLSSGPVWQALDKDSKGMVAGAAFVTLSTGPALLTLMSKVLQVRDVDTGKVKTSLSFQYYGSCDWRQGLVVDTVGAGAGAGVETLTGNTSSGAGAGASGGPRAWVFCPDDTFNKPTVYGVDLESLAMTFSATRPNLKSYWPHPIAYWREADLLLGLSAKYLYGLNPLNGSEVWRAYPPPSSFNILLAYAMGQAQVEQGQGQEQLSGDVSAAATAANPTPLLYLLGQSESIQYVYIAAYNSSGIIQGQPAYVPIRVDQFTGSLLLWPDGLTLTLNGWDSRTAGSNVALVTMRFDPASAKWSTVWTAPSWPGSNGRTTTFAAPRANGSVVLAGWDGVYQYN